MLLDTWVLYQPFQVQTQTLYVAYSDSWFTLTDMVLEGYERNNSPNTTTFQRVNPNTASLSPMSTGYGFRRWFFVSVFPHDISKTDATRITKLDMGMLC